ncbi:MAG: glycoprotein [Fushun phasmavirus 2]|uniref:Glycoprotein n=1 Tax=Fushun phasmavirus 2 TaxID=2905465 RepID=A0A8K1XFF9_9VIRU|nr:MAG: glycoprotein [Fushun phasmavirus 2]UHM27635.1 MAG: glycoprotein [Fushun phasmavirus 2]
MAFAVLLLLILYVGDFAISYQEKGKIEVSFGKITVENFKKCTIIGQDFVYDYNADVNSTVPGLWFGLISFTCDDTIGHLISKFKCKDCGIYCIYNEYIEGCQTGLPYWAGVCIGVIAGIVICAILWISSGPIGRAMYHWVLSKYYIRKDKKHEKMCRKVNKITGEQYPIVFGPCHIQDENKRSKIEANRNKLAAGLAMSITNTPIKSPSDERTPVVEDEFIKELKEMTQARGTSVPKPYHGKSDKIKYKHRVYPNIPLLLIMCLLVVVPSSDSCDTNLYLASENRICISNKCQEITSVQLTLKKGELVCFTDPKGSRFTIRINDIKVRKRYALMYYTSDYEVKTASQFNCASNGECQRGNDFKCKQGYVSAKFDSYANQTIQGFSCHHSVGYCKVATGCWHDSVCIYYKWWINAIGSYYPIYKEIVEDWEMDVNVVYKSRSLTYQLQTNRPNMNLADLVDSQFSKIPLIVTNVMFSKYKTDDHIIIYNREAYYLDAASRNMPEHNKVGDFQISLNHKEWAIDGSTIKCEPFACETSCTMPEPKLKRFVQNIEQFQKVPKYNNLYNDDMIETKTQIEGSSTMVIGNIKFDSLLVSNPDCRLSVIMTYGCKSCTEPPTVIIGASGIKKGGSVPFSSNCSFDTDLLSCNDHPTRLVLRETADACYISVGTLNQTIDVVIDYIYLGSLRPSMVIGSQDSAMDSLKHILTTDDFISMVSTTAIYFSILGTVTTIFIRGMTLYFYHRTAKIVDKTGGSHEHIHLNAV